MLFVMDITDLDLETAYRDYFKFINKDRVESIEKYKAPGPKLQSFGAGIIFKKSLQFLGFPDSEIDSFLIDRDEYGKPFISNRDNLFFNISHSHNMVIISWSEKSIGCDVEKCIEKDLMNIAERFFTNSEYSLLKSINDTYRRNHSFYRIWTLKEAFIKNNGRGLGLELNSFNIPLELEKVTSCYQIEDTYLKEYFINEDYCFSVASSSNDFDENYYILNL